MIVFSNRENCIHPHLYLTQFQFSFLDGISRWRVGTGLGMDHRGRHRGHDRGDEGDDAPADLGYPRTSGRSRAEQLELKLQHENYLRQIQMRPSGVRVSNPSYIPTVVSINANQTPIYGPMGRHLTKRELARAFGFPDKMKLLENSNAGFTALGNAVHVEVAKLVAKNLLNYGNNFGNNVSELQNIDDTFDILSA